MSKEHPNIRWRIVKERLVNIVWSPSFDVQQKYMHKRTTHKDKKAWGDDDFTIPFVTVFMNKKNIWWFPKDSKRPVYACNYGYSAYKDERGGSFDTVKNLIIRYLDIPRTKLLEDDYSWDFTGITEILRAADKRIGQKRLSEVIEGYIPAAQEVFTERFKK